MLASDVYWLLPNQAAWLPADEPVSDPAAHFMITCLLGSARGGVAEDESGRRFIAGELSICPYVCTCGATTEPFDFGLYAPELAGAVIPPLGMHVLLFHRLEVPMPAIARITEAAETSLARYGRRLAVEPAASPQLRQLAELDGALEILQLARDRMATTTRPDSLVLALQLASVEVSPRRVGWSQTAPYRAAIVALASQILPSQDADTPTDILVRRLRDWTGANAATYRRVLDCLDEAIRGLQTATHRLSSPSS